MNEGLNRLKVVLVERGKTSRWLANELGIGEATISKWCTNKSQPSLEAMVKISQLLNVELTELVRIER